MQKKTYVNTEKVRTAPLSALEDYTNRKTNQPMRLSDRSLAAVKIHARYTPPTTRVSPFVTIADDESEDDYDAREEEGQDLPPPYTSRRASRVFATRPAASSPNLFTLLHSARLDVAYNGRFPALPKATARLATPQQDVPYRTQVHGYRPSGRPSLTRYGLPAAPPPTPHRPGQYGQAYRQPGHHWNHESETTPLLPRHRRAGAPEQPRESIFLLIASSVGSFLCYMADSFIAVHKASTYVGLNLFQLLLLGGLIFGIIYGAYLLVVAIVGAVVGAWQWTAQEVTYIGAAIGGFFVGIGHWFEGAWDTVVTALVSAWQWIVQGIEGIGVAIEEFFRSLEG